MTQRSSAFYTCGLAHYCITIHRYVGWFSIFLLVQIANSSWTNGWRPLYANTE